MASADPENGVLDPGSGATESGSETNSGSEVGVDTAAAALGPLLRVGDRIKATLPVSASVEATRMQRALAERGGCVGA